MKKINRQSLHRIINFVLLELGIKPSYKGFYYIREAVILFIEYLGPDANYSSVDIKEIVPKILYIDIGKKLSVTIENVEKSIRVAINNMWQTVTPGQEITVSGRKYTLPENKHTNMQIIYTAFQYTIYVIQSDGVSIFYQDTFDNILMCRGYMQLPGHFAGCDGNCEKCPKKV